MKISIGVQHSPREIELESDQPADEVRKLVERVFAQGERLLWLTDDKGKQVAVPVDKIAYVEIGPDKGHKKVGFGREGE